MSEKSEEIIAEHDHCMVNLAEEIQSLRHDLTEYIDIANRECNRAEQREQEVESLRARVGELEKAAKEARLYLIGGNLIECNNELEAALKEKE